MLESVFPLLPALFLCHAWITVLMARTLADESIVVMQPECFPT